MFSSQTVAFNLLNIHNILRTQEKHVIVLIESLGCSLKTL